MARLFWGAGDCAVVGVCGGDGDNGNEGVFGGGADLGRFTDFEVGEISISRFLLISSRSLSLSKLFSLLRDVGSDVDCDDPVGRVGVRKLTIEDWVR